MAEFKFDKKNKRIDIWMGKDTDDHLHYFKYEILTLGHYFSLSVLMCFYLIYNSFQDYKNTECEKYVCIQKDLLGGNNWVYIWVIICRYY